MEPSLDGARNVLDLAPVVAGEHDHAGPAAFGHEPLEEIRAGMRAQAPAGRLLGPRVVGVDLAQVVVEFRPDGRVDVNFGVDAGDHVLLHECRVKVARVQDGESHRR